LRHASPRLSVPREQRQSNPCQSRPSPRLRNDRELVPGNVMRHLVPARGIPPGGVPHRSLMPNKLALRALRALRPGLMQRPTFPGD
jgi:hypothetical protein